MKWAFYLLVVLNAAFFSWQMSLERSTAPVVEPTTASRTSAPGYVNRLLLVSELESGILRERVSSPIRVPSPVASRSADAVQGAAERPLESPGEPGSACYTIGPLEDGTDIEAIGSWLGAEGLAATLRVDERREVARYWVYLPPAQDREEADARTEAMRAAGIDDIYVIPRGDMAFAISLGLFSQRASLDRRLQSLERRGFTPSVAPRYRSVTASWYDVRSPADSPLPAPAFSARFPDVELRPAPCAGA